jgi:hypothetical protein
MKHRNIELKDVNWIEVAQCTIYWQAMSFEYHNKKYWITR